MCCTGSAVLAPGGSSRAAASEHGCHMTAVDGSAAGSLNASEQHHRAMIHKADHTLMYKVWRCSTADSEACQQPRLLTIATSREGMSAPCTCSIAMMPFISLASVVHYTHHVSSCTAGWRDWYDSEHGQGGLVTHSTSKSRPSLQSVDQMIRIGRLSGKEYL